MVLLRDIALVLAQVGPDNLRTRSIDASRSIGKLMAERWPEAQREIAGSLACMVANSHGNYPMMRYLRITQTCVDARIGPTPDHVAAVVTTGRESDSRHTYHRWTSQDWAQWTQAQIDRQNAAKVGEVVPS